MPGRYRIAVIPGDGIGAEVVGVGLACLNTVREVMGNLSFEFVRFPWGSEFFLQYGRMMPDEGLHTLADFQAVYLGAVGDPRVPDHVTLHGLLIPIKMGFDLYAGLRPAYLFPGVESPLFRASEKGIDIIVIRENSEGEYCPIGGRHGRMERHMAVQTALFTKTGCERIITYAFEYAIAKKRKKVTSITKSNAQIYGMVLWDEVFKAVASRFPEISTESKLVDAACHDVVRNPERFDVIVASNLFADILSDLTAAIVGGLGVAPGGSFNPSDRGLPGLFDPVHGSAPDIAGKGIANPIGAVLTAAMMLEYLGEMEAAALIFKAAHRNLREKRVRTRDLGGRSGTKEVGEDLVRLLKSF